MCFFLSLVSCLECGKPGGYLCIDCVCDAAYTPLICPVCRRPAFYGKTHAQCAGVLAPDGGIAIWRYEGVIKKAIKTIKYKFADRIADDLSLILIKELNKHNFAFNSPLLIPIPLSKDRERWRGFNQAAVIGEKVAKALHWDINNDLLLRSKSETNQASLRPFFRSRNIHGKFAVNERILSKIDKKSTIILFDDVWTSGSTLFEATKTIKSSGIKNVWIMSVAR